MKPLTCGPKVVPSRLCHVIKHSEWSCLSNLCLPRPNIHIALLQEVSLTPNEARAFGRSVVKKGLTFYFEPGPPISGCPNQPSHSNGCLDAQDG